MSGGHINIRSAVRADDNQPFVVLRWGRERGQLTPREAAEHAMSLLQAAAAAEYDALVIAELRAAGMADSAVSAFLDALRKRRDGGG